MSKRKSAAAKPKGAKAEPKTNTATASGKVSTPPWKPSAMEDPVPRKTSLSPSANVYTLETPPLKQYAPQDPSAASRGIAMISVVTKIASKTANLTATVAPDEFGLSDQKHTLNEKDLVSVLATVIADKFSFDRQRRKLIQEQFTENLPRLGADNERTFVMLNEEHLWFHNTIHKAYSQVRMPVVCLLTQMANYMGTVLQRSKYLTP